MGYTHYFPFKKKITDEKTRDAIIADMKEIEKHFEGTEHQLFDGGGDNKGVVYLENKQGFAFNGDGSKGEDHETMYIDFTDDNFNFCKTARKPYDVAVTATALMLKYHLGEDVEVSGDGGLEGFADGRKVFNEIFPGRNIIIKEDEIGDVELDKEQMALGKVIEKV